MSVCVSITALLSDARRRNRNVNPVFFEPLRPTHTNLILKTHRLTDTCKTPDLWPWRQSQASRFLQNWRRGRCTVPPTERSPPAERTLLPDGCDWTGEVRGADTEKNTKTTYLQKKISRALKHATLWLLTEQIYWQHYRSVFPRFSVQLAATFSDSFQHFTTKNIFI